MNLPKIFRLSSALLLALTLCKGASAQAAMEIFIRFASPAAGAIACPGTSTNLQFGATNGWIQLDAITPGTEYLISLGSSNTATAANFQDLNLSKKTDRSSVSLFRTCTIGGHYDNVEIVWRDTVPGTNSRTPFYSARLRLVFITKIDWSGEDEPEVTEHLTLKYGAMQWNFNALTTAGAVTTNDVVNWDVITRRGGSGPLPNAPTPTLTYPTPQTVGVGGAIAISPNNSTNSLISFLLLSKGGYTGGVSVDPVNGSVSLNNAAPMGGPFNIVVRGTDFFGSSTDASFALTVAAPVRFTSVSATPTNVILRLTGAIARQYQLQSSINVNGAWNNLGTPRTSDGSGVTIFTDTNNVLTRFYRALELP